MQTILKSDKWSVHWSCCYSEGTIYLQENMPEIIILDLKLPDGNGFDILRIIREQQINVRVYIFSINSAMRNSCLRNGADGFFDKNTDGDALVETVISSVNKLL
ncbi:MAG: response regulator [Bacteroidota bacterium]